jgi:MFS family permease
LSDQQKQRPKILSSWAFWLAVALLVASQSLYLGLSLLALQKFESDSKRLQDHAVVETLSRRLSSVTGLGVPLGAYRGLNSELERAADRSSAELLVVAAPNGQVLAGFSSDLVLNLPESEISSEHIFAFSSNDRNWEAKPVFALDGSLAALICWSAAELDLGSRAMSLARTSEGRNALLALILSTALTSLSLGLAIYFRVRGRLSKRELFALILTPFLLGQAAFSLWSLSALYDLQLAQSRHMATNLARNLALDLDRIIAHGLEPEQISNLRHHLDNLLRELPLVSSLTIQRDAFKIEHPPANAWETSEATDSSEIDKLMVIHNLAAGGQVMAFLSPLRLRSAKVELLLDNLTLTLVSTLVLLELIRLLPGAMAGPAVTKTESKPLTGLAPGSERLRPLIFVCLVAMDMPLSFIPLKMAAYDPAWGNIPLAVLLGLPISMEALLAGVGMVLGGRLADTKGGSRMLMAAGIALAALGSVVSFFSRGPVSFVFSRGMVGLGYGTFNIAAHFLAADCSSPQRRGEIMGDMSAGFFSGGLCGCLIGGLLADRFGFDPVFFLAAIILGLSAVASAPLMARMASALPPASTHHVSWGLKAFFKGRQVKALLFLSVLPSAAAMVGLLNYLLPLHLSSLGHGPAMISRLNVMLSLIIVVLAPINGKALDRHPRPGLWLCAGGLLAALAGPPFLLWPTLVGAVFGLALLGLSNSINEPVQQAYLLSLPQAAAVGDHQALSLFSGFNRLAQTCGPLIVGAAWGGWGLSGLAAISGVAALAGLAMGMAAGFGTPKPLVEALVISGVPEGAQAAFVKASQ